MRPGAISEPLRCLKPERDLCIPLTPSVQSRRTRGEEQSKHGRLFFSLPLSFLRLFSFAPSLSAQSGFPSLSAVSFEHRLPLPPLREALLSHEKRGTNDRPKCLLSTLKSEKPQEKKKRKKVYNRKSKRFLPFLCRREQRRRSPLQHAGRLARVRAPPYI